MRYHAADSWLDGQPAAVTRNIGNGSFTYVGAWLDAGGTKRAVQWMLMESNLTPDAFAVPEGVEVYRRVAADRRVFIVENMSHAVQTIALPEMMQDALTDQMISSVKLPRYGVAVLVQTNDKKQH